MLKAISERICNTKNLLLAILLLWVLAARLLTGCSMSSPTSEKVRDLDFHVVAEAEVPEELQKLITEKKTAPFKLTYSDDQNLYIVTGYGEQATGGYSITVNALYLTANSIVFDTDLMGPEPGSAAGTEVSYPYIVVKTEYLEEPLIFQS